MPSRHAVDHEPEARRRVREAQDEPRQHVFLEPNILEETVQLLDLAALQHVPGQLGSEFREPDVLALDQRENQGGEERQAGGT